MRTFATMLASVAALTFVAACTSTSPGDEVLTKSELRQLITGKSVSFDGGGTATYYRDGRYKYVLNGADTGTYSFRNDQVCVAFDGGGSRCDTYVQNGDRYFLINARGGRFQARIG